MNFLFLRQPPPATRDVVRLLAAGILLTGFLLAQAGAIAGMVRLWDSTPMYSYGYLVPAISAFLVWSRRHALARLDARPAWLAALAALLAWAALLLGGRLSGSILLEQLALPVAVVAIVLGVFGWAWLRATWVAVAYLLLMVPVWDGLTEPLHLRFQLLSATLGIEMLHALGIPAYREGTFIQLPSLTIEVARACSGVNYLIAVLALGIPLAYLYLKRPWRRVVLVGTAVAVAALSNSLRVALIGLLVHLDVGSPLHGPGHVLHGLFVAGIGHVVLLVGLQVLSRGEAREPAPAAAPVRRTVRWAFAPAAVLAVCFWSVAGLLAWHQPAAVPLRTELEMLPAHLGAWLVEPSESTRTPDWWPSADRQLRRRYRTAQMTADVHVAYFETQEQHKEVVSFRADDLHRRARRMAVAVPAGSGTLTVNVVPPAAGTDVLTVFWYDIDGVVETSREGAKLRVLWHAVGRNRTNGAVVIMRVSPVAGAGEAPASVLDLAGRLHDALGRHLPGRRAAPAATDARSGVPRVGAAPAATGSAP